MYVRVCVCAVSKIFLCVNIVRYDTFNICTAASTDTVHETHCILYNMFDTVLVEVFVSTSLFVIS